MSNQHKRAIVTINLATHWQLITTDDAPPVQLAIQELQQYWQAMTGQSLALVYLATALGLIGRRLGGCWLYKRAQRG